MKKVLAVVKTVLGALFGIGAFFPVLLETSDKGIKWLDLHPSYFDKWPLIIAGVVSAFLSAVLIPGYADFKKKELSTVVEGETFFNPSWGWAVAALLINLAIIGLLE